MELLKVKVALVLLGIPVFATESVAAPALDGSEPNLLLTEPAARAVLLIELIASLLPASAFRPSILLFSDRPQPCFLG